MTVDYSIFLVALALLWLPRSWMHRGPTLWKLRARKRTPWNQASLDGGSLNYRREFFRARNYFDFFRAALATWALVGGYGVTPALIAAPTNAGGARVALLAQAGILFIGLVVQLVRWERGRISLTAPVFFLGGMTLALGFPIGAICAFVIAWLLTPVLPSADGFLTVQAVVFGLLGAVLGGLSPLVLLGVALVFLPVLVSLLARRPLMVLSRRPAAGFRNV